MKEYRDEAMKHLEAAGTAPATPDDVALATYQVNAAIASGLIAIAETLHAIQASLDKLTAQSS